MKNPQKKNMVCGYGVLFDGEPAHYEDAEELTFYRKKKDAVRYHKGRGYKIVPITITYDH